jgi:phage antirepressor YoqD-like protein
MNRTVAEAATLLNLGPRKLFDKLRELKIINHHRELIASERNTGRFYTDTRSRWNSATNGWTHYGVIMVTEKGIEWLAKQLNQPINKKDAA